MKIHKALLIGVPNYFSKDIPGLDIVDQDLADMYAVLEKSNYIVTPLDTDNLISLSSVNILAAIRRECQNTRNVETLLLYFSGHGLHYNGKDYLVPSDAILDDPALFEKSLVSVDDTM